MIKCAICKRIKENGKNHWWSIGYNVATKSLFLSPLDSIGVANVGGYPYININVCGLQCCEIAEQRIKAGENPVREIPE